MSDYDKVQRGSLKLKGVEPMSKKKKKKKAREEELAAGAKAYLKKSEEKPSTSQEPTASSSSSSTSKLTKAEMAFKKQTTEREKELAKSKAKKSHKERIMEFNQKLENLSEHYDIPKVSWTK